MSDTNALVKQENKPATFAGFPIGQMLQIREFAKILLKSGLMPPAVNTEEKAIILSMKGYDLGLTYMQSIENINVIQGKPSISASLIQAKIRQSGVCEYLTVLEMTDKNCKIETKRTDEKKPFTYELGEKEAKELGLLGKDNYKKQPKNMYFSRCMSAIGRYHYADVFFGGIYVPEELGAEDAPETLHGKGLTNTQENADFKVEPEAKINAEVKIIKTTTPVSPKAKRKAKDTEIANAKEITFDVEGEVSAVKEEVAEPSTIVDGQDTSLPLPMLTEEELAGVREDMPIEDEPIEDEPIDDTFEVDVMAIQWKLKENIVTEAIREYKKENKQYDASEAVDENQDDFRKLLSGTAFMSPDEINALMKFAPETAVRMKEYIDHFISIRNERYEAGKKEYLRLREEAKK